MKAFKIVRRMKNKLVSLLEMEEPWLTIYIPGEWTEPAVKGTRLYVCEDIQEVESLGRHEQLPDEVWECEVRGDFERRGAAPYYELNVPFSEKWWRKITKPYEENYATVEAVKLIRKI